MQKYTTSTWHNLVPVRDRHMNPYIFVNNIQRTIQNSVDSNLKIQIPNGHFFKFLTVKNSKTVNAGEQPSKHVYNIPKPLGHHIWSILSLSLDKIWGGDPCPVVRYNKYSLILGNWLYPLSLIMLTMIKLTPNITEL